MSELRDAIAGELRRYCHEGDDDRYAAEDVLDLAEMQAVRKALSNASYEPGDYSSPSDRLTDMGLPPSVVAWVLEGET